jgi:hypothetical protein
MPVRRRISGSFMRGRAAAAPLAVLLLQAPGCAGSTLGSGVGERVLEEPPYYAGRTVPAGAAGIGRLPVSFQAGQAGGLFDPAATDDSPMAALLHDMNAYLDSLGFAHVPVSAVQPAHPPDVQFGCLTDAVGDCDPHAMGDDTPRMRLAVTRSSAEWAAWVGAALVGAGLDHALILTVEVSDFWPRQKNWRGQKEIRLGTGFTVDAPWLTALDAPASVLQLTGALIGPDGKAVRIGAEGLAARTTNVLVGGFGVQALVSDEEVAAVRTARREELPGQPLVWQVALRNLVADLTGRRNLAER